MNAKKCLVVLATLTFMGLAGCGSPNPSEKYGECTMHQGNRTRWYLDCPNLAAFHAAVDEFAKRNPDYEIKGIVASRK